MTSSKRGRARGEGGAALLEMAIVTPLFLLLIFGMINFGFGFSVRENMIHGAQEGLRSALVAAPADQVCTAKSAARSRMVGIIGAARAGSESATAGCSDPSVDLTVTTSAGACSNSAGQCLTVTMSYPYRNDSIVAIPGFNSLTPASITVSATQRTS